MTPVIDEIPANMPEKVTQNWTYVWTTQNVVVDNIYMK